MHYFIFPSTLCRVQIPICPCQHLLSFVFLIVAILISVKYFFGGWGVLLIIISFIIRDIEHVFIYLLVICMTLEKWLFNSLAHFKIILIVLLLLISKSFLYILQINPLSDIQFTNIFFHFTGCLYTLLIISFTVLKLLVRFSPTCLFLFSFFFFACDFGVLPIWPSNLTLSIYPKEMTSGSQRNINTSMFIAALFTIVKMWERYKCPRTNKWIQN